MRQFLFVNAETRDDILVKNVQEKITNIIICTFE